MARKPAEIAFTAHPNDAGLLADAQELMWDDFVKLTTTTCVSAFQCRNAYFDKYCRRIRSSYIEFLP